MTITADITLIARSTAGFPDKQFTGQEIEISADPPSTPMSVDGHMSVANHPATIIWYGGDMDKLAGITHVKIVARGLVLINAPLTTHNQVPKAISGGVSFDVMQS